MSTRSLLLTATLAIAASSVFIAPAKADTFFYPNLTDHNAVPRNYPPTYPEVQTKVLDLSSSTNVPSPWIQFEFRDQENDRQFNSFRAVNREMWERQTSSDDTIRTRDLANPYTTSLASSCAYYQVTGIETPDCILLEPQEAPPKPEPRVELPPAPPPARPVPALW